MSMPMPPGFKAKEVKPHVTYDEVHLILRQSLRPEHHENPSVLRFINEYLVCRDAKQAAKAIGLEGKVGVHMRNQPDIFLAITKLTDRAVMKYGYDASEIVEKVKEIALVDPADLQNEDGTFIDNLRKMAPELRRAIKKMRVKNEYGQDPNGIQVITGKIIEYEFWDKMKAVELLGREKEIFKETKKIEHDIGHTMASTLLESKKRGEDRAAQVRDVTPSTTNIMSQSDDSE